MAEGGAQAINRPAPGALSAEERQLQSARIASTLDATIGKISGRIVGTYWPFRGEPDLRNWGIKVIERGGRIVSIGS